MDALEHEGSEVAFLVEGPDSGFPVVFVHGALLDHSSWAPQAAALARRYRVIRWDLPGHGRSLPIRDFDRSSGPRALLALLDHLGVERAALVGLSVGGWLAQEVARTHPQRVAALACFDTTSIAEPTLPGVALRGLRSSSAITAALPFPLLCRALPRLLARTEAARAHARDRALAVRRSDFLRFWRGASHLIDPSLDERMGCPLLIAHGQHDLVANIPKYARRWAGRCPDAQLVILEGAGHLANLDAPEAATEAIEAFLAGVLRD